MNRDEIVDSTYRAALSLNKVKMGHGLITRAVYEQVEKRILFSLEVVDEIDRAMAMEKTDREKRIAELRIDVQKNISTIGEKKELEWPTGILRMNFFNILKTLVGR